MRLLYTNHIAEMVPTGVTNPVGLPNEITQEMIKEVAQNAKSASEKLKALRTLTEPSVHAFISSGGISLIADWISQSVDAGDTGIVLACLGCLEKLPITTDILRETKIGKIVTEKLKMCTNQVAVERARKLINMWKALALPVIPTGTISHEVVPAKKATGIALPVKEVVEEVEAAPPSPKRARKEEKPVDLVEIMDDEDDQTEGAVSALASLLDTLPELESLSPVALGETSKPKRRGIRWKSDNQLVQMVEFAITDTCLDLKRTIQETHGGISSLHPHGDETIEEHGKFIESRRKERAMAGRGLAGHTTYSDMDDEIEVSAFISEFKFPPPIQVYDIQATFLAKNLKSYEKQDLADLHAARREVTYETNIPDTPGEPSTSTKFYTSMNTTATTVDVFPSGIREYLEDAAKSSSKLMLPGTPVAAKPGMDAPTPTLPKLEIVTFEEEFVKLDSKLQTAIMGSRDLLKLFTQEPVLLRDMTLDKINLVLTNLKRPQPASIGSIPPHHSMGASVLRQHGVAPPSGPPMMDDRKSWGASTIKSSVRTRVMTQMAQHPQPHGYSHHPQNWPPPEPHGNPPRQDDYYRQPQPRPTYTGQPGQHQYHQRRGPPPR